MLISFVDAQREVENIFHMSGTFEHMRRKNIRFWRNENCTFNWGNSLPFALDFQ
jgi:hypothetical protein